jgi:glutaredoxin
MDTQAAQKLKVYWRVGCSSCVRVKEFLTKLGVDYESINVSARPEAMADLRELGVRTVPVVVRGREYVFAQELADVSRFLGKAVDFQRLPAPALVGKWLVVLSAAQRHAAQIPQDRLARLATEGRDRSLRDLACHVYQIADAFLQAVENGVEDLPAVYNAPPPEHVKTPADIRAFGAGITAHVERWWAGVLEKSCAGTLKTYYGVQPLHHVLERSTWHSAQHARQIQAVLEELGIRPDGPLTEKDYAGLPMPVGLWE